MPALQPVHGFVDPDPYPDPISRSAGRLARISLLSGLIAAAGMGAVAPARAEPAMPASLIGSWCGIDRVGRRIEIARSGYEEGDGVCRVTALPASTVEGLTTLTVRSLCSTGAEGRRHRTVVERFTPLHHEGTRLIYRRGSLYEPRLSAVYRPCKS